MCRVERQFARTLNGVPCGVEGRFESCPASRRRPCGEGGTGCVASLVSPRGAKGGCRLACFSGGAGICSASEPYSYNRLRNRICGRVSPVFSDVFHDLWRTPSGSRVLAAPCYPPATDAVFNCVCRRRQGGCTLSVATRRLFVFVGAGPTGGRIGAWLLYYYRCGGCQVSEPGWAGLKDWQDGPALLSPIALTLALSRPAGEGMDSCPLPSREGMCATSLPHSGMPRALALLPPS